MIIKIKRDKNPPQEHLRKQKLSAINNSDEIQELIKYDWNVVAEYADERLQDFHLFCVSIVKDLVKHKFKTNESGHIDYKIAKLDEEQHKQLLSMLSILYKDIDKVKKENEKNNIRQ